MADIRAKLAEALRDRYVLERELGRGGMATVYLARDLKHDRHVALKILHPELAVTLGAERFQREIQVAARLQHPHIVTVLDSGEAAGRLWFSMPFVEGETLRERLRREGPLPVREALRLAREVADGLEYAHLHGVIHRDIKPENILLSAGHALIADFGIARALSEAPAHPGGAGEGLLTPTGLVVGTPAYMSPEQASGERTLGPGADLYSLAVVLYQMLGGIALYRPNGAGRHGKALLGRGTQPARRTARGARSDPEAAVRKRWHRVPVIGSRQPRSSRRRCSRAGSPGIRCSRQRAPFPPCRPSGQDTSRCAQCGWRSRSASWSCSARRSGGGGLTGAAARPTPRPRSASPCFRSRTWATRPTPTSPTAEVTDAVRGKLTALPSMRVIGSNSSAQYREAPARRCAEIGRELGVDYLLAGKVRWQKGASGAASRVQVSPELIDVSTATLGGSSRSTRRSPTCSRSRPDIAGRVAQALDVTWRSVTRQQRVLENRPTRNLAAYDAYLQGQGRSSARWANGPTQLRGRPSRYFEQAVALDSSFVAAWAALSAANSYLYS